MMFGETIFSADSSAETAFVFLQIMFAAVSVTIFAGALSERTKLAPLLVRRCRQRRLDLSSLWQIRLGQSSQRKRLLAGKTGIPRLCRSQRSTYDCRFCRTGRTAAPWEAAAGSTPVNPIFLLAVLGVFILWFGWFGFNGGCIRPGDPALSKVFLNTCMGAAYGTLGALLQQPASETQRRISDFAVQRSSQRTGLHNRFVCLLQFLGRYDRGIYRRDPGGSHIGASGKTPH